MLRCLVPLVAFLLAAQARVLPTAITSVQSISVTSEGSATVVTVQADGALPPPRVGVLPDPPRIYLDFRGVKTTTSGMRTDGNALIRGVRVAINQPDPLLTRVVVDLVKPIGHRIETGRRDRGQVALVVSDAIAARPSAATAPAQPVLPAPSRVAPMRLGGSPAGRQQPQLPAPSRVAPMALGNVPATPPAASPSAPTKPTPSPASAPPASATSARSAASSPTPRTPTASLASARPSLATTRAPTTSAPPAPVRTTPPAATPAASAAARPSPPPSSTPTTLSPPPPSSDVSNADAEAPARTARSKAFVDFGRSAQVAAVRAPAKDIEKYMRQALPAIDRLETARPILVSLDAVAVLSLEQMGGAAAEFRAIRAMLAAIEPPRSLEATHETLCSVCELGALAASTRLNAPTPEQAASAASAAAGALMLLERARAELGLPPVAARR